MKDRYDVLVIGGGAAGVGAAVGARPQRDVLGIRLRQSNCGRRREPARGDANMGERTVGHTSKTRDTKKGPRRQEQEWRLHCQIPHTETSSYLGNLAVRRGF